MQGTEIQEGRHANMKNLCVLTICFSNYPRRFILVSTHKFLGRENSRKSKFKISTETNVHKYKMAAMLIW